MGNQQFIRYIQYREYIFWRILQYVSVLHVCYYFILFDDKILLDIKIFNK